MRPKRKRIKPKETFTDSRIIFVADRGLNTSDNIYWINGDNKKEHNPRDGYVYGQSIRGADEEFKKWVVDKAGYLTDRITDDEGNEIIFKHKSRVFPKELHVNVTKPGSKKPVKKTVQIDQKQMVYYSAKYARKQKADRETMIARAKDLIAHPKKYNRVTSKGSSSYVLNISFSKDTGEIVDGKCLMLDEVFKSRPVYVWKNEHIDAHFATCFLALVLIRLLELKLGRKYPVKRIFGNLR